MSDDSLRHPHAAFDEAAYAELSAPLKEPVAWRAVDPRTEVYGFPSGHVWAELPGGHKWLHYFSVYDGEFAHLRGTDCRLLEIGVYKGASLQLWKRYFGAASTIVGVDVDAGCAAHADEAQGIHVRIGSQADTAFLQSVVEEFGPFDLVIDDGSHCSSHQIASFNALFGGGLKQGGLYFVEDLECVYWGHRTGQLDQPVSSMDFFKMLVDMQHQVFRDRRYEDFALHVPGHLRQASVERISTLLQRVSFYRGCVAVKKAAVAFPQVLHI